MSLRGRLFIVVVSLFLAAFILLALKRKKINEEYCLWWIGILAATDFLVLNQTLLQTITYMVGALVPISTLTLFALICISLILIFFSMKISVLTNQVRVLIQTVALQEKELEDFRHSNNGNSTIPS